MSPQSCMCGKRCWERTSDGEFICCACGSIVAVPAERERSLANTIARLRAERDSERKGRQKCEAALRDKDKAMGVLFERLSAAGVDCSDLIP
jgi:hypothetical protein